MASKRAQFNLEVKSIPEIELMKNMPNVILPIFWFEEGVKLEKKFTNQIKPLFM